MVIAPPARLSITSFAAELATSSLRGLGGSSGGTASTGAGAGSGDAVGSASGGCARHFLRLTGGDLFEPRRRHSTRIVVNDALGQRSIEIDPPRIGQDCPTVALSRLPRMQHAFRIRVAPAERCLKLGRHARQGADLVRFGRERVRPSGAQKRSWPVPSRRVRHADLWNLRGAHSRPLSGARPCFARSASRVFDVYARMLRPAS